MIIISKKFENLFIDFDGVIVDSNKFKEKAIEKSILELFGNNDYYKKAISYFNEFAGVGRGEKLFKFFNREEVDNILQLYNQRCMDFLTKAMPTVGLIEFLKYIKNEFENSNIYILSGCESNEIEYFLRKNDIFKYFKSILASEKSKLNHLLNMNLQSNDIFIGDSKTDFQVSTLVNIKFILMQDYSSKKSALNDINIYKNIFKTNNFNTLLKDLKL